MNPDELWRFLPRGYLATVAIEGPILLLGLSPAHSVFRRVLAAFWLTACTYPIVVLVLPLAMWPGASRAGYLLIAETFAPVAECLLFWLMFDRGSADRPTIVRDMATIAIANVASFAAGEFVWSVARTIAT